MSSISTMGTKDSQSTLSSNDTSAQSESTGVKQSIQRKSQSTTTGYSGVTGGQAKQHFDVDISSRRQFNELQRLEQTHGRKVHDWLDEGIPREAMGTPDEMRAFRIEEGTSVSENDEAQNRQSVQRSTKANPTDESGLSLEVDPDPQLEREAEATAQRVMQRGGLGIQRLSKTEMSVQRFSMGDLSSVADTVSDMMSGGGGGDIASMGSDMMGGVGGGDIASMGSDMMGGGLGDVTNTASDMTAGVEDVSDIGSDLMGGDIGGPSVEEMSADGAMSGPGMSATGISGMPPAATPAQATPESGPPGMGASGIDEPDLIELLRRWG